MVAIIGDQMNSFLRKFYQPSEAAHANRKAISEKLIRLVAVVDSRVVGTVQYYPSGDALRLVGLAVLEEYRCCGIARALVNHVLCLARRLSLVCLRVSTVKETGNVPIFQKLGFGVIRETRDGFCVTPDGSSVVDVELEMKIG